MSCGACLGNAQTWGVLLAWDLCFTSCQASTQGVLVGSWCGGLRELWAGLGKHWRSEQTHLHQWDSRVTAESCRVTPTKLQTGLGLTIRKEGLAEGLEGCCVLASGCINVCFSNIWASFWVCVWSILSLYHLSRGTKKLLHFRQSPPQLFNVTKYLCPAPQTYVKLQNWLSSLPWISAIFLFCKLRYGIKWVNWSNARDVWTKNRKHDQASVEGRGRDAPWTARAATWSAATCGEVRASEVRHTLCLTINPEPAQECSSGESASYRKAGSTKAECYHRGCSMSRVCPRTDNEYPVSCPDADFCTPFLSLHRHSSFQICLLCQRWSCKYQEGIMSVNILTRRALGKCPFCSANMSTYYPLC